MVEMDGELFFFVILTSSIDKKTSNLDMKTFCYQNMSEYRPRINPPPTFYHLNTGLFHRDDLVHQP